MSGVELISVRANPPVCFECGRKLAQGGWQYVVIKLVTDTKTFTAPAHRICAKECEHMIVAESVGRAPKGANQ